MEFRQLKTFQVVAQLLSFNRAAETLNYSQSTVSTQIRLLEEEFNAPLFNRLGKRICLTEAGQMLMHYSRKMLDIEKEALTRVSGCEEPHGSISIRIPQSIGTYVLPSVLAEFQTRFPKIGFNISTCAYETLVHELKTGIIDVAFLLADAIPFSELKTELLTVEPLVIISNPEHALAKQTSVKPRDLMNQTIILPKHDCSYKMIFQQILTEEKISSTLMEINSIESIKRCVIGGLGIAMMPLMAVHAEINQKKVIQLPWPQEELETGILMIWHKGKWLSPAIKSFMDSMRSFFSRDWKGS